MTFEKQHRTAVVTGATSGIGWATAIEFATHGVNVVAAGRREDRGAALVEATRGLPGEVAFVRADVTVGEDVERLMASAVSTFGRLDYAFNNAGASLALGRMHEYTEEQWDFLSDSLLKSVWRCMKYEITHMLPSRFGVIINNASIAGIVGGGSGGYSAMKHGVVGLTKSATKQYADDGLRFNAVCPGWIDTDMTAGWEDDPKRSAYMYTRQSIKRPGRPEEVAALVRWMCSDDAAFVTGVAWPIDGGFTA